MGCSSSLSKESIQSEEFYMHDAMNIKSEIIKNFELEYIPLMYTEKNIMDIKKILKTNYFSEIDPILVKNLIEEIVCEVDIKKVYFKLMCFFTMYDENKLCLNRIINRAFRSLDYHSIKNLNYIIAGFIYLFTSEFNF